ncbi:MAG: alkaline phosphatase D family protein [Burkholderiaceae bacterium]
MTSGSRRTFLSGLVLGTAACQSTGRAGNLMPMPRAPIARALPSEEQQISRIYIASCLDEEKRRRAKVLDAMAARPADLLLMLGDNVYGDRRNGKRVRPDPQLTELTQSLADLTRRPDFKEVLKTHPVMVAWDDHDYGMNDGGRDFAFRARAEDLHETFWGLKQTAAATRPGTYYARAFGPAGARVQVIMLDTRSFRSALARTDQRGAPGKERYLPSEDVNQEMLGAAQWRWLEQQLSRPADVRVIASSVQVLPTNAHGFESWSRLPRERDRLLATVSARMDGQVVFVSGDRHRAFIYKQAELGGGAFVEMTSSSINRSSRRGAQEMDRAQLGAAFVGENFGEVFIDWRRQQFELVIRDSAGQPVNRLAHPLKG